MLNQFAKEYQRNENGWVLFPKDAEYRKTMFPPEVNTHPAKANVFLVQAIIEYVSEAGQTIMDIMAGTGSIMVGALIGRDVICIEISEKFHQIQQGAIRFLEDKIPGVGEHVSLINAPCQTILPIPNFADHIIFSPQYAGIMLKKSVNDQWNKDIGYDFVEYSRHPLNLGTMSEFLWTQEMEKVYDKCYKTLRTPGSMCLIVKDHMAGGERVRLVDKAIKSSMAVGFKYSPAEHFKWAAPGMPYTVARKAKGIEVVEDESVVVLRKEA